MKRFRVLIEMYIILLEGRTNLVKCIFLPLIILYHIWTDAKKKKSQFFNDHISLTIYMFCKCCKSQKRLFSDKSTQGRTCKNSENIKLCEIETSAALTLICSSVECKKKMPPAHLI